MEKWIINSVTKFYHFLDTFCPKLLNGGIQKGRAPPNSWLHRPSDCTIPVLWQHLDPRKTNPQEKIQWISFKTTKYVLWPGPQAIYTWDTMTTL